MDEEIDCRVNFGFTSKRRFGSAMKIQELNFENIPIIEESNDRTKSLEQLRRRVICFLMGKVTFTMDDNQVDHSRGIYKLIPQDELTSFLSNPITAAVYLREYCIPFFKENSEQDIMTMTNDPGTVHEDVVRDTNWLSSSLSGATTPPPGTVVDVIMEAETLVQQVHANTPQRRILKEYLIHKLEVLPGCAASSKGKKTKLSNFVEALDTANSRLFNQVAFTSCLLTGSGLSMRWTSMVDLQSLVRGLTGPVPFSFYMSRRDEGRQCVRTSTSGYVATSYANYRSNFGASRRVSPVGGDQSQCPRGVRCP